MSWKESGRQKWDGWSLTLMEAVGSPGGLGLGWG